jgi:CheY-like chemotaxis protein
MKSVLVVDDNAVVRRLLRGLLEHDGCLVTEAADGLRAIAELQNATFDAVLLDLQMPVLDGLGALRAMRELHLRAPVVLVTGSETLGEVRQALQLGAGDYLTKPFRVADLRRSLQKVTGFDFARVQRTRTDVLLVDRDEDFAQVVRSMLGEQDELRLVEDNQSLEELLAHDYAVILVGESNGGQNLLETLAQRKPSASVVKLETTPAGGFGTLARTDDAVLELLTALRATAAWWWGNEVRAGRVSSSSLMVDSTWHAIRHGLKQGMHRALEQSSKCVVDLCLLPNDATRLSGLREWLVDFAQTNHISVTLAHQRSP